MGTIKKLDIIDEAKHKTKLETCKIYQMYKLNGKSAGILICSEEEAVGINKYGNLTWQTKEYWQEKDYTFVEVTNKVEIKVNE